MTPEEQNTLWRSLPPERRNEANGYVMIYRNSRPVWLPLSQLSVAELSILRVVASAFESKRKQSLKRRLEQR